MKSIKLFLLLTVLGLSGSAWSQPVEPDPDFGDNGIVVTPNTTEILKTILTTKGEIISTGYYYTNDSLGSHDYALAKYNSDGSPDNTFGDGGLVFNLDTCDGGAYGLLIQPDDKILVSGDKSYGFVEISPTVWTQVSKSFLARYKPNGEPDSTFGENGFVIEDFNVLSSSFTFLALCDNNQILAGGMAGNYSILVKFNPDGSIDTSFGDSGMFVFDDPDFVFLVSDFQLLQDGSVLCYGGQYLGEDPVFFEPYSDAAIVKLGPSGNYDTSFGNNGKVLVNLASAGMDYCAKSEELEDGKILLAGYSMQGRFLMKLNSDGSFDTSFGDQGIKLHSYHFSDIEIQDDGKILLGGSKIINNNDAGYTITRFNANGTLDTTFNGIGYFDLNISGKNDYLQCVNMQADGKLLLSGSSRVNDDGNFTLARLIISENSGHVAENYEDAGFMIFPNPFRDILHIQSEYGKLFHVVIRDINGRTILSEECNANKISIPLAVPKGIYFCSVYTPEGVCYTEKIVKQ